MSKGLAVTYDRASSKKQEENYTRQDVKRIGPELAQRYGYDFEPEPRSEIMSGEELKTRPVILGILKEIAEGKIQAIITANLTRLSRDEDVIDGLIIKKTCRDNNVVVIDFSGKVYDFENDHDQDTAFLEFWFAARDKRQMLSNTIRGMKEKALRGEYNGGRQIGYQLMPLGKTNKKGVALKKKVIDSEGAQLVRRICSLYMEHSGNEVAAILNNEGTLMPVQYPKNLRTHQGDFRPWTVNDIMRIVTNPIYAGWVHWQPQPRKNGEVNRFLKDLEPQMHFDASLQIISQQEFDRLQMIRAERRRIPPRGANGDLPFSIILKCPKCGHPMGGNIRTREKGKKLYLQHSYRCKAHFDNRAICPMGYHISCVPVASAVIPFVVELLQGRLVGTLEQAAQQYSGGSPLERMEAETRADLEKVNQGMNRVTDSIARGVLLEEEAKEKLEDLRRKKEKLFRDIRGFEESKGVSDDIAQAVKLIQDDLESVLWKFMELQPRRLSRILRLIFKEHSVVVEAYWDSEPLPISTGSKRRGRLVQFELQEPFDHGVLSTPEIPRGSSSR